MFTIDIADLLASYTGDSQSFSFEGTLPDGALGDNVLIAPLKMRVKIICVDDGVDVLWEEISTIVRYDGQPRTITLTPFTREYRHESDPLMSDVWAIIDSQIDLTQAITEEITIARGV